MTDRRPDGSADVGSTTDEADGVQGGHDVVLGRVGLEVELDGGVDGELHGADPHSFRADVHLFDDVRQQVNDPREPLDANAVRSVDDEDDVAATAAR